MIARLGKVTALAMSMAYERLDHWARAPFLSPEARARSFAAMEEANADTLLAGLCQLRGTALKLAQIVAAEQGLLSERFRERLQSSQYAVTPLSYATIRKVITRDFGASPEEVFARFEPVAFAAASLGQVHRATLKTGEEVAVKILYPGVADSIQLDLLAVRTLLKPINKSDLLIRTLAEMESRLADETDYAKELSNTLWFRENCTVPGLILPRAYPASSANHVLTTEYLEGEPLAKIIPSLDPVSRDQIGQTIHDLFNFSIFTLGALHTDPHPGNYLWLKQKNALGLVDFGSVKREIKPSVLKLFRLLLTGGARAELLSLYGELGADIEGLNEVERDGFYAEVIEPYQSLLARLREDETYYFNPKGSLARDLRMTLLSQAFHPRLKNFATDFTLLHRAIYGLISVLTDLGATVRWGGGRDVL